MSEQQQQDRQGCGQARALAATTLAFGEGHLDRVHVAAVGRQVEELCAPGGDRLTDAGDLVGGQIVEHHDIAAPERGCQDVADVDLEGIATHRPVEHPGRRHARQAQAGEVATQEFGRPGISLDLTIDT